MIKVFRATIIDMIVFDFVMVLMLVVARMFDRVCLQKAESTARGLSMRTNVA